MSLTRVPSRRTTCKHCLNTDIKKVAPDIHGKRLRLVMSIRRWPVWFRELRCHYEVFEWPKQCPLLPLLEDIRRPRPMSARKAGHYLCRQCFYWVQPPSTYSRLSRQDADEVIE